jgi:hypothetical protein
MIPMGKNFCRRAMSLSAQISLEQTAQRPHILQKSGPMKKTSF